MKADLTRNTFDPLKHYARVLMQQGRVQLDADWNEQAAILLSFLRNLAADWIGPHGGPKDNLGFLITGITDAPLDFRIGPGHYYVQGVPCYCEMSPFSVVKLSNLPANQVQISPADRSRVPVGLNQFVALQPSGGGDPLIARVSRVEGNNTLTLSNDLGAASGSLLLLLLTSYMTQPDYPVPVSQRLAAGRTYQVYLDVWERVMTYIEDDSMREVALGGPDTAARTKIVWQVKVTTTCGEGTVACCTPQALTQRFQPANRGMLKAIAKQKGSNTDPCVISPDASYRGPENQLYRVEIHTGTQDVVGNPATPTFKWSRENGSVTFPIISLASGGGSVTVTLENLGRDDRFGLNQGDWVEVVDDDYVLQNRAEPLLQVTGIDNTTMTVTLAGGTVTDVGQFPAKHPLLRRWDQQPGGDEAEGGLRLGKDNATVIVEGSGEENWLAIENGIEIQFQLPPSTGNFYRTGDYWLIPARTATGDIEWPVQTTTDANGNVTVTPLSVPPNGVMHWYAPLAVIHVDGNLPVNRQTDCRFEFPAQAVPVPPAP